MKLATKTAPPGSPAPLDEPSGSPLTPAAMLALLESRFTEFTSMLRGLTVNETLRSETVILDGNGVAVLGHGSVPFAAVTVANWGDALLSVTNDAPATNRPTRGTGVQLVGPGTQRSMNLTGQVLTLYGNAGDAVGVTLHARPIQPSAGQVAGAGGEAAASVTTGGPVLVAPVLAAGATTLAAANPARKSLLIFNDATGNLLVALGNNAGGTAWSFKVAPGNLATLAEPATFGGAVTGWWDAVGGNGARITEVV